MLKVLKRDGSKEQFHRDKIYQAIMGACEDLDKNGEHETSVAKRISREIERELEGFDSVPIQKIEDRVEEKLMASHMKDVARQYIVYRASKASIRMRKTALDLINDENDELKTENSNKNTLLIPTQRDYLAGILCKDISREYFPKDILNAHDKGMIHIHDMDFSPALPMTNCCLINLDDMLQNGTKLSDMDIVKPKSFLTASAIAAQIVLAVSSSQYGGTTISLSHLAPFVRISKEKYERNFRELGFSGKNLENLVAFSLQKEIKDGLQTLIYNILTFANSNGQSPFVSIFLWINEKPEYLEETVLLIEEMIRQRKDGFLDKKGKSVTLAFPKLLYVLDENNTYENSEYFWLTKLAAECTAKRMVPDYISAKKMREFKEGNVFGPMGCVDGNEIITYKYQNKLYVESFERMWFKFSQIFNVKLQPNKHDKYIDLENVEIYDTKEGFVKCFRIIRNLSNKWLDISLQGGRHLLCTEDHPFETENRGVVLARDLLQTDTICVNNKQFSRENIDFIDENHPNKNISIVNVSGKKQLNIEQFSYDVTTESEHFEVSGIYSHNCRSFLQPYYDENNLPKFYGRFNQGVVTLNLPYIAMQSQGCLTDFWRLLDESCELCYEALMIRHHRLKNVKSDVAPILWQQGALARLKPGETIQKLLYNDYSSISLGYAGLYECVKYMLHQSHTQGEGKEFALEVMEFMNKKCDTWKEKTNIGFSIYGTPIESTTAKFANSLKDNFGVVEGVSDKNYITNSYHVHVTEPIDAFTKLKFESDFQSLSKGGMISYIEVPTMFTNIEALLSILQYIYENTQYAEINTKLDVCEECGFEGEIECIQDEKGKYIWKCPCCGNTHLHTMKVFRRTCGYIGSNYWNQGRTAEIHDRVLHL